MNEEGVVWWCGAARAELMAIVNLWFAFAVSSGSKFLKKSSRPDPVWKNRVMKKARRKCSSSSLV